ncbi:hypothetical protein [Roseibium litorale]|uniref:Uncharacterized protein n=1 Tax=Roseibium litorale TaxID=2803841 RepID=A0ABR9CGI0_9HYPH|nr:hypothetical protein [Roseibium litorale]MBD8889995.1 hypothetical protein [Roseibium litorale]
MTRLPIHALLVTLALLPAGCALGPESSLFDAMQAAQTGGAQPPKVTASTTPAPPGESEVNATISRLKSLSESRQHKQEGQMLSSVEELLILRQKQQGDLVEVPASGSISQN